MAEFFRDFWWLLFAMSFVALGVLRAWFDCRARLETIRALREMAANGQTPPAALTAQLNR